MPRTCRHRTRLIDRFVNLRRGRRVVAAAAVVFAPAVVLTLPDAVRADTFTVMTHDDSGPGSLRQAILDANQDPAEDVITFAPDVTGTIDLLSALPPVATRMIIRGPGADRLTVRRGQGELGERFRIFTVSEDATIAGLTVANGYAPDGEDGGGVATPSRVWLDIVGCTFRGNRARFGGAVAGWESRVYLRGCAFVDNAAQNGGAVSNIECLLYAVNCTLFGNAASQLGGAFYSANTTGQAATQLYSCTVRGNRAGGRGGAIAVEGTQSDYPYDYSDLEITATILSGNTAGRAPSGSDGSDHIASLDPDGTLVHIRSAGYNLADDNGGGFLTQSTDIRNTDPRLAPPGYYGGTTPTMALLPGSPAIDAAAFVDYPDHLPDYTDQRGIVRPQGAREDIGAFESQGFTLSVADGDKQSAGAGTAFVRPLKVLVRGLDPAEPVAGGLVAFAAPASGPGATLNPTVGTVGAVGTVSTLATANRLLGSYTVTASAAGAGNTALFRLTNVDQTPPTIRDVSVTPSRLWSPDNKLRDVTVLYAASDDSGIAPTTTLSVKSNDPGMPASDVVLVDAHHLKLRASKTKPGRERVYTITITATDAGGNNATATAIVTVPKSN